VIDFTTSGKIILVEFKGTLSEFDYSYKTELHNIFTTKKP
jgi:hypothetical protein